MRLPYAGDIDTAFLDGCWKRAKSVEAHPPTPGLSVSTASLQLLFDDTHLIANLIASVQDRDAVTSSHRASSPVPVPRQVSRPDSSARTN